MTLQHPLPDEAVELIARRFHVLADPTRIRLLDNLRDREPTVQELAAAVGSTQQNVSKHLALLVDVGIVGRRREGATTRYRVVDPGIWQLCEDVCGAVEQQLERLHAALHGS